MKYGRTADLIIPAASIYGLSIPDVAVTDGSGDPEKVELPCVGGFRLGRRPTLPLPLDAHTATIARRWTKYQRFEKRIAAPAIVALAIVDGVLLFFARRIGDAAYAAGLTILAIIIAISVWELSVEKRLSRPSFPTMSKGGNILIRGVPVDVCQQWTSHNPEVQATGDKDGRQC